MHESSHCSTFSSAFDVVSVLDLEHSNRCVVVCHFCFNLHFPDDIWCGASFHMLICCLCIFFGEVSVKVFDPFFFNWVVFLFLSFKSFLYILDNSPLSDGSFANIFPLWLIFSFPWHCLSQSSFSFQWNPVYQLFLSWIIPLLLHLKSHHWTSLVAQWLRPCLPMQGTQFEPWSGKIPHAIQQLSLCATATESAL